MISKCLCSHCFKFFMDYKSHIHTSWNVSVFVKKTLASPRIQWLTVSFGFSVRVQSHCEMSKADKQNQNLKNNTAEWFCLFCLDGNTSFSLEDLTFVLNAIILLNSTRYIGKAERTKRFYGLIKDQKTADYKNLKVYSVMSLIHDQTHHDTE